MYFPQPVNFCQRKEPTCNMSEIQKYLALVKHYIYRMPDYRRNFRTNLVFNIRTREPYSHVQENYRSHLLVRHCAISTFNMSPLFKNSFRVGLNPSLGQYKCRSLLGLEECANRSLTLSPAPMAQLCHRDVRTRSVLDANYRSHCAARVASRTDTASTWIRSKCLTLCKISGGDSVFLPVSKKPAAVPQQQQVDSVEE